MPGLFIRKQSVIAVCVCGLQSVVAVLRCQESQIMPSIYLSGLLTKATVQRLTECEIKIRLNPTKRHLAGRTRWEEAWGYNTLQETSDGKTPSRVLRPAHPQRRLLLCRLVNIKSKHWLWFHTPQEREEVCKCELQEGKITLMIPAGLIPPDRPERGGTEGQSVTAMCFNTTSTVRQASWVQWGLPVAEIQADCNFLTAFLLKRLI